MIRGRLAELFALDGPSRVGEHAQQESSKLQPCCQETVEALPMDFGGAVPVDLRQIPTVDERVSLYLRALHGQDGLTAEQYASARNVILRAMAADIAGRMKARPESAHDDQIAARSPVLCADVTEPALPQRIAILSVEQPIRPLTLPTTSAAQAQPRAALSGEASKSSLKWKLSKRSVFTGTASALVATVAIFLIPSIPTSWFVTNPSLLRPQVTMQILPPELFEAGVEFQTSKKADGDTITISSLRSTEQKSVALAPTASFENVAREPNVPVTTPSPQGTEQKSVALAAVAAAPAAGNPSVHVVAAGETLRKISRLYGKPVKVVAKANNISVKAKLKVGDRLIIPGIRTFAVKPNGQKVHRAE
jgi:LysM repeat protein